MKQFEKRTFAHKPEIRANDGGGNTLHGYGAVFYDGTPETEYDYGGIFKERIMRTAFDTITEKTDIRSFFNHNEDIVLGRTASGTMRVTVDDVGLAYEVSLPDTQAARDLAESVRRGDIDGASFMFQVMDGGESRSQVGEVYVRELHSVKVFEIGPVTFPAYDKTTAGVRSQCLDADGIESFMREFESKNQEMDKSHMDRVAISRRRGLTAKTI